MLTDLFRGQLQLRLALGVQIGGGNWGSTCCSGRMETLLVDNIAIADLLLRKPKVFHIFSHD
jgi:hypothetical protein